VIPQQQGGWETPFSDIVGNDSLGNNEFFFKRNFIQFSSTIPPLIKNTIHTMEHI